MQAAGSLYLIKLLLQIPISVLAGVGKESTKVFFYIEKEWAFSATNMPVISTYAGLTCLFSVFIIYEQCEEEINKLKEVAIIGFKISKETLIARLQKFFTKDA